MYDGEGTRFFEREEMGYGELSDSNRVGYVDVDESVAGRGGIVF
jgi:hypothetical protein